jgi:transposase
MEAAKRVRRRRTHSEEFKQAVIEACGESGASVAGVALANGLNANQVRRWMRERNIEPPSRRRSMGAERTVPAMPAFVPMQLASAASTSAAIQIEVRRGQAAVKIEWPVEAAGECAAWLRDWLR